MNSTITITYGDQAENHVGMQKIGKIVREGDGFQYDDLEQIANSWKKLGAECEIHDLCLLSGLDPDTLYPAYVLVIKNALSAIQLSVDEVFTEQKSLEYDKHAYMYGRVVQKKARWNLCFGDDEQEPIYSEKKGRIVAWKNVPLLESFTKKMPELFGKKAERLYGEGNYYYDVQKCGIGFHGDSERRKVIALRLGAALPIHYQWYLKGEPEGDRIVIPLEHGDIYVMSEKAVGTDWKRKTVYTLRHATGCSNFTKE